MCYFKQAYSVKFWYHASELLFIIWQVVVNSMFMCVFVCVCVYLLAEGPEQVTFHSSAAEAKKRKEESVAMVTASHHTVKSVVVL